jgi:hypothetical protein
VEWACGWMWDVDVDVYVRWNRSVGRPPPERESDVPSPVPPSPAPPSPPAANPTRNDATHARTQDLVGERRCFAQHQVVADVDAERQHARDEHVVDEGHGELGADEVLDVVEGRDHEEHAGGDERGAVVEELEGVALELLLVGGGEDLREGGEEDGEGREDGAGQVHADVVDRGDAHAERDGHEGEEDGARHGLAVEGALDGDGHGDARQLGELVEAYRVVRQVQVHEGHRAQGALWCCGSGVLSCGGQVGSVGCW